MVRPRYIFKTKIHRQQYQKNNRRRSWGRGSATHAKIQAPCWNTDLNGVIYFSKKDLLLLSANIKQAKIQQKPNQKKLSFTQNFILSPTTTKNRNHFRNMESVEMA